MTENAQGLVDIGKLVLQFARVNRVTLHEDGVTPESDTDHTVMLSVCACALAKKLYPDSLDIGLVSQFAIVHDLVEAYAMDTDSFGLTQDARVEKQERERVAEKRINDEFESRYPWIPETIRKYEKLDTKEARFVKTVDKIMPKVTHILNSAVVFKQRGETFDVMKNNFDTQLATLEQGYASDMPELIALLREMYSQVLAMRNSDVV